ncbi:uncharacterized protein DS421_3g99870 [Arachis hypogaea]|nr:uncharacterized protein DS421_3g99870 [Arachis hypogaea]
MALKEDLARFLKGYAKSVLITAVSHRGMGENSTHLNLDSLATGPSQEWKGSKAL